MTETFRTQKQNNSMHKYFSDLSEALNDAGLDMKKFLKPGVDIPWTPSSVKRHIWKPVQDAMFDKESTADLNTAEVDAVYKVISRHISEKHGINVEFPDSRNGDTK